MARVGGGEGRHAGSGGKRVLDGGACRDYPEVRPGVLQGVQNAPGRTRARPGPKPGSMRYSYAALKVLQRVWAASGGQCGRYLEASMRGLLDNLEARGHLVEGTPYAGT